MIYIYIGIGIVFIAVLILILLKNEKDEIDSILEKGETVDGLKQYWR